jgi:hypothetical protein
MLKGSVCGARRATTSRARMHPSRAAGLSIQATTNLHSLPISAWAGLAVLAAWAAAALAAGGLLLRVRDA